MLYKQIFILLRKLIYGCLIETLQKIPLASTFTKNGKMTLRMSSYLSRSSTKYLLHLSLISTKPKCSEVYIRSLISPNYFSKQNRKKKKTLCFFCDTIVNLARVVNKRLHKGFDLGRISSCLVVCITTM